MTCERSIAECYGYQGTGGYSRGDYLMCLEGGSYRKGSGLAVPALPCFGDVPTVPGDLPSYPPPPPPPVGACPRGERYEKLLNDPCDPGYSPQGGLFGFLEHCVCSAPGGPSPPPGVTPPGGCPRGERYDKPMFGFGACDDGYVSSEGALVQGWGSQCICAAGPDVPGGHPGDQPGQPGQDIFGILIKTLDALPLLLVGFLGISVLGLFKK